MPTPSANPRQRAQAVPAFDVWFWVCLLGPALAAIAVYAPAARNGFVWDDPLVFAQLDHFHSVGDLLVPPAAVPKFYYRPFIFLTFLLERTFGGTGPWHFHVSVIAWHVAATLLTFIVGLRLLGSACVREAGLAALIFAVHPLHSESVAWIAGRSDVVATVFVLLALYFSSQVHRAWTAWAAAAAVLLGCLAKEVALAALVLIPARDLFFEKKTFESRYLPLGLAAAAYFTMRYIGIGSVSGGLVTDTDSAQILRDVFAAIGWYAAKLVAPVVLNAYVPQVPTGAAYPLLGVACVLVGAGVSYWSWRRGWPIVGFAILWLVVTIAPSLWVIVRRSASAVLAERYAYLPSVAAVWLVAWGISRLRPPTAWRGAAAVVLVLAAFGGVAVHQRISVWHDNLSFWSDVAEKVPDYSLPQRELADALMAHNRLDEAEVHYHAALQAVSDREGKVMAFNNLGNLYVRRERFDDAETAYKQGLALYPQSRLYSGLGRVAIERAQRAGNDTEARRQLLAAQDALTRAIAGDAEDYRSHNLLGQVLFNLGNRDDAKRHFEQSLALNPSGAVADVARKYLQQIGS